MPQRDDEDEQHQRRREIVLHERGVADDVRLAEQEKRRKDACKLAEQRARKPPDSDGQQQRHDHYRHAAPESDGCKALGVAREEGQREFA